MSYVELRTRSAFSFLEGASLPEDIAGRAAACGMDSIALLDRDGVYGAPQFHKAAKKSGIVAFIGAEVTAAEGGRYGLLAESRKGYQNLCRLLTLMKMRSPKGTGCVTIEEMREYRDGLLCLTGGEHGILTEALRRGDAPASIERWISVFGRSQVHIELQRHFDRTEEEINHAAIDIARTFSLPVVATNGVSHATAEDSEVLDVFTCLRHHRTLQTAGRLLTRNRERHLKSPKEMAMLFADLPQAVAHTREIASRLGFTLCDLGYEFPKYPTPDGESMMRFLREMTDAGARKRFQPYDEKARKQIERELALIEKLELPGYFLIVWDIVQFCKKQNILAQGRGSAANSAVCYALEITAVDPVRMELLFERFLSEERGEWPDIDIDLPSGDDRERVIQYVYERYGRLGAAMTANVITYRGKSAARETGKVLGFDGDTLDRLTSLVSAWEYQDDKDKLDGQFHQAGLNTQHPRIRKFLDLCVRLQALPRHLGQHSGGMVICQGQLDAVVPLEPASMPGRSVVQWDKDDCADMGIIKVDLLGLGMMAVLKDSIALIHEHYLNQAGPVDAYGFLGHLPQNDPAVYDALQRADTVGMFQVESRAQMSCLPRLRPKCFYDVVVQVAIIRPGPIVGNMVHPYLNRRQGREPVVYAHPSLEPVLRRTLGVPLFQEQLLRMAMIAAGFTGGEAEELRRAFGFKRSEKRMHEIEFRLREGMTRQGISGEAQDQIARSIASFALYGFPESHAASFALIAYASAFLKCHYLAAFTASLLNNQPMGFYSPATLVKDAQRHGLKIRPIDVLRSNWLCTLEPDGHHLALRLGLNYARGLNEQSGQAIVNERDQQSFQSIDDLVRRVPGLRKNELVMLADIGALNSLDRSRQMHRRDALWQVERASRRSGPLLEVEGTEPEAWVSPLKRMSDEERLVSDFRGMGLTIGAHPMSYYRAELDDMQVKRAVDLQDIPNGTFVRTAGCVIARQRPGTAKGFVFMSLEDETGISNAIITPALLERQRLTIIQERFLLLEGRLQNVDNVISVKAVRVRPLRFTAAETRSHDFH